MAINSMLNLAMIQQRMSKLDDWALESNALEKTVNFNDFKEILLFMNKIGEIAERHGNHPDILIAGNTIRIALTSFSGLSEKEFDIAEEIDKIKV